MNSLQQGTPVPSTNDRSSRRRWLWAVPGSALAAYLIVAGAAPLWSVLDWYLAQSQAVREFGFSQMILAVSAAWVTAGVVVLALTAATVAPRRLRGWTANLLLVLAVLLAAACFLAAGARDPRSWLLLWVPALVVVRLFRERSEGPAGRRAFWTAVALAAVVAAAPLAAWATYQRIAAPSTGELVQTSASPSGRWQIRTYALNDVGLGPDSGLLRVEVVDLASGEARTVYIDDAEYADRRAIRWSAGDQVTLAQKQQGSFTLDAANAPSVPVPADLFSGLAGLAAAVGVFAGVLLIGSLAIVLGRALVGARAAVKSLPAEQV